MCRNYIKAAYYSYSTIKYHLFVTSLLAIIAYTRSNRVFSIISKGACTSSVRASRFGAINVLLGLLVLRNFV